MAYAKKPFTKKEPLPEFRLIGTSMFACVYPENMHQERDFTRSDGTTWTRKAQYSVNLLPNAASFKQAEKIGLSKNIRQPNDYETGVGFTGPHIQFTRLATLPDGTKMKPPVVKDLFGEPMTDFIGNGSEIEVVFTKKDGKDVEKYGPNVYLKEIIVRNLVPYEQNGEIKVSTDVKPQAKGTKKTAAADSAPEFEDDMPF